MRHTPGSARVGTPLSQFDRTSRNLGKNPWSPPPGASAFGPASRGGELPSTRLRFGDSWIPKKTRSDQANPAPRQRFLPSPTRYPNDAVSLRKRRPDPAFPSVRKPPPAPSGQRPTASQFGDALEASSSVTETGGSRPGRGPVSHRKGAALISRQRGPRPVEPDASRGARPARGRLTQVNPAPVVSEREQSACSIPCEFAPNGGDRDTLPRRARRGPRKSWRIEAGANPAGGDRGCPSGLLVQLRWRGDLRAPRGAGPGRNLRPGDRTKRPAGKSSTTRGANP